MSHEPAPARLPRTPGAPRDGDSSLVADRLTEAHFTFQHEQLAGLTDVAIDALDPFLRALLLTDGTVSRTLEAHTLARVGVELVDQVTAAAPEPAARYLEVEQGEKCIRRRVTMHMADTRFAVWAESYLIPGRLPDGFLGALDAAPQGIGGSLQQLKLESSRELLRFGLGAPPRWAQVTGEPVTTMTRYYRIITQAMPSLLISEAFAVELRLGRYHLIGSSEAALEDPPGAGVRFQKPG
jgi:chorismate-pyruvate lyase